jgi:hypothetical protein
MAETKQNLLDTKSHPVKNNEICEVCDYDLHLNSDFSKKVGILGPNKKIIGWMCPKCNTEFDYKDRIMYIYGEDFEHGEA